MKTKKKRNIYLIMDARADYDFERATCFEVCYSREEAEANKSEYGDDCVIIKTDEA